MPNAEPACPSIDRELANDPSDTLDLGGEDGVCARCAAFPWMELASRRFSYFDTIDICLETLDKSSCRICRFLAEYLAMCDTTQVTAKLGTYYHTSTISRVCSGYVGCINVHDYRRLYDNNPFLLVTYLESHRVIPDLQALLPRYMDVDIVKGWLANRVDCHQACDRSQDTPRAPLLKVIDCERKVVVPAPAFCKYVALSYVWGHASAHPFTDGFDLGTNLPKTIADSIHVVKLLGFKYLWVDRYCIDQSNDEEKHAQIMQMADIYQDAHFTIFAAAGNDSDRGLPGVSDSLRGESVLHETIGSLRLSVLPFMIEGLPAIAMSQWAKRGWTFQEAVFSRRRLFFTEGQYVFTCNTDVHHEVAGDPDDEVTVDRKMDHWLPRPMRYSADQMSQAMFYLEEYSTKDLSYDSDALNAISGAMNTFRKDSIYHIWGVPFQLTSLKNSTSQKSQQKSDHGFALLWRHPFGNTYRRPGFPSWSPVGWAGKIYWVYGGGYTEPITASMHNISIHTKHRDIPMSCFRPSVEQSSAHDTRVLRVASCTADVPLVGLGDSHRVAIPLNESYKAIHDVDWDVPTLELKNLAAIKGLLIPSEAQEAEVRNNCDCIMLIRSEGDHYERIGIVQPIPVTDKAFLDGYAICDNNLQIVDRRMELGHERKIVASDPRWWREYFKEETILLG
ncbi:hypothetical protein M3J07_008780 [Ascochyta lentis]